MKNNAPVGGGIALDVCKVPTFAWGPPPPPLGEANDMCIASNSSIYKLPSFLGCTTEQLWRNLERRSPPLPLTLDTASKEFLWKGIVHCTELEFFFVEEPLTPEPLKEEDKEITEVHNYNAIV